MVCDKLDIDPTMGVFLSFFVTKLVKGSWVTLRNRQKKGFFTSHSNYYKYWKDKFVRVKGRENSLGMLGIGGVPLFQLS